MVTRRRCSECGCRFTPSPRARATQRVCGAGCRASRDRKLARARRRRDIDECRTDERERQRKSRGARTKTAGEAQEAEIQPPGHAPASASKPAESLKEIAHFVDRAFEVSRATLMRDLSRIWPQIDENLLKASGDGGVSHASLRGQGLDLPRQFDPDPAGRHA
jgi:hypothetical protein